MVLRRLLNRAFLLKIIVGVLMLVLKRRLQFWKYLLDVLSVDTLKFSLFPSLFSLVYRILISVMRNVREKDDGFNPIFAAAIASFTIFMDNDRSRRQKVALYTLIRATHSSTELSHQNGIKKKIKNSEILLFMLFT